MLVQPDCSSEALVAPGTAIAGVLELGRPVRVDSYAGMARTIAKVMRQRGVRASVAAPIWVAPPAEREPRRRSDHPRANGVWKGLLWLAVIAVAVAPFPWW